MRRHKEHPYITVRQAWLLWSINERLAGRPGVHLPPPDDSQWINDHWELEQPADADGDEELSLDDFLAELDGD